MTRVDRFMGVPFFPGTATSKAVVVESSAIPCLYVTQWGDKRVEMFKGCYLFLEQPHEKK